MQGQSVREVFDRVSHAVVVVYTSQTEYSLRSSQITPMSVGGIGSGVLISPTQILTAAHVVQAADEVMVQFPNGETMTASVVGSRQNHDVALLELEGPAMVAPVVLGDSDSVAVGDQIFVVGAPLGQVFTLTVGYVSARRTSSGMLGGISTIELIQTDAAINQGNSGGPMFNLDGQVVGIVSHILSESGGSQGLGFAVSARSAREALLEGPSLWTGLEGMAVTGGLAELLNVPPPGAGILVQRVAARSLAEQVGLRPSVIPATIMDREMLLGGDIILMVQGISVGTELENLERIVETIAALPNGDTVFVTVLRGGEQVVLSGPLRR
jgi:S1-C subfamily serine protease